MVIIINGFTLLIILLATIINNNFIILQARLHFNYLIFACREDIYKQRLI